MKNKLPSPLTIAWCRKNRAVIEAMNAKFDKEKSPSHWNSKGTAQYWRTRYAAHKLRAEKLNRTAAWADEAKMQEIFKNCPPDMSISHEIPLQGERVSGLNHELNLGYLSLSENCSRNNKFVPRYFKRDYAEISLF
jgi:hypothetical protein